MKRFSQLIGITFVLFIFGSCGGGSSGGTTPDITPPTILSISPPNNATGVSVNTAITATFSETMTISTVNTATFTLNNGVSGAVTYGGMTATFTPSSNLAYSTTYTATITTGVKDTSGNAMASNYTWTFTTGTAPVVISKLNDTGVTGNQCYQAGSDDLVNCGSVDAISLNNAQDGMVGRDANSATNSNTDGKLGFNFSAVPGGCVLDNITGLMWEVKTTDGGLRDWNKTYTNYDSTTSLQKWNGSTYVAPTQADIDAMTNSITFINSVNSQALCGYSDWRLPTAVELQSIVDYGFDYPSPTIDTTWFPNSQRGKYLSASYTLDVSYGTWGVQFTYGDIDFFSRSGNNYVRLVRAGQSPTSPRFTISADDEEVTDSQTKLVWRRCAEGMNWDGATCSGVASTFTHEAALQRAAAFASSTGIAWRLPNIKELSSIADNSLIYPAIDPTAFPVKPTTAYLWSASPVIFYSTNAWLFSSLYGYVINVDRNYHGCVWLVRTGQ